MSSEKFTPGPWIIKQYKHHLNRKSYCVRNTHTITNASGLREICKVKTGANATANLNLISAAPEMYAELADICRTKELEYCRNNECAFCPIGNTLKKARGEE